MQRAKCIGGPLSRGKSRDFRHRLVAEPGASMGSGHNVSCCVNAEIRAKSSNSPLEDYCVFPVNPTKSIRFQTQEIQMNKKWILAGAMAFGLAGVVAAP